MAHLYKMHPHLSEGKPACSLTQPQAPSWFLTSVWLAKTCLVLKKNHYLLPQSREYLEIASDINFLHFEVFFHEN